jgi:hypothetical protein
MKLQAGAAKREITPPTGMGLSGFIARLKPSRAVAEPIHVRALVVGNEEHKIAIVQADFLGFASWQVAEVREYARRTLGISPEAATRWMMHGSMSVCGRWTQLVSAESSSQAGLS